MKVFVDSNVPMYVAGSEHPNKRPATAFLHAVRSGKYEAYASTEVLQEILYRYCALNRREVADRVYSLFVELCTEVYPVTLADTDAAKRLLTKHRRLGARDAIHAAVMHNRGIRAIATFDKDFDEAPGIQRLSL